VPEISAGRVNKLEVFARLKTPGPGICQGLIVFSAAVFIHPVHFVILLRSPEILFIVALCNNLFYTLHIHVVTLARHPALNH
jgi:hypothetical protein